MVEYKQGGFFWWNLSKIAPVVSKKSILSPEYPSSKMEEPSFVVIKPSPSL